MTETAVGTRRPADAIPQITGLRFLPEGTSAELLNISPTGLLAESAARLHVGRAAIVQFEGTFAPQVTNGRVARCQVAVMKPDGSLRYHIAIEFDAPLALHEPAAPRAGAPVEHAVRNRW